jgi:hypothetical protein
MGSLYFSHALVRARERKLQRDHRFKFMPGALHFISPQMKAFPTETERSYDKSSLNPRLGIFL